MLNIIQAPGFRSAPPFGVSGHCCIVVGGALEFQRPFTSRPESVIHRAPGLVIVDGSDRYGSARQWPDNIRFASK